MTRPATLAGTRLVAIDGRSGAGKSTLASEVAASARSDSLTTRVITLDDLYPGWKGLPRVGAILNGLLRPLAAGRRGTYQRWSWHDNAPAGSVAVDPVDLMVIEGVGAGSRAVADLVGALVWVCAPDDVRRERALARDGDTFAPHWQQWAQAEDAYLAQEDPRGRADLTIHDRLC